MTKQRGEADLNGWAGDAKACHSALMHLTSEPGWSENPDAAQAVRNLLEVMDRPLQAIVDELDAEAEASLTAAKARYTHGEKYCQSDD